MSLVSSNTIIQQIYYLLWLQKDTGLKANVAQFTIPDSVIIQDKQISDWFFTSKKTNLLLRKNNFTAEKIFEKFTKNISKSGIVAYFVHMRESNFLAGKCEKSRKR